MYTLGKLRHHIKSLSPLRELRLVKDLLAVERVQARERKVLSASKGEEMYTLGKLRHQIKSFSPLSELRPFKDLLADERVQASKKSFSPMSEFRRVKSPSRR